MKKTIIAFAMVLSSCASAYKANDLSDNVKLKEVKGHAGYGKIIALNDKDEVVVQEETSAADELLVQSNVNLHWQEELDRELYYLKWCRKDMADPRLGGHGELPVDQEIEGASNVDKVREELGMDDDGNLKIVRQAYFTDKLKKEKAYGETLKKMLKLIKRHKEECEWKMGQARVKAGLPASRYANEWPADGLDTAFGRASVDTRRIEILKARHEKKLRQLEQEIVQQDSDERG